MQSKSFRALPRRTLHALSKELTGSMMDDHPTESIQELIRSVLESVARECADAAGGHGESESHPPIGKCAVIFCGTGFIMPDVRQALGIVEPR